MKKHNHDTRLNSYTNKNENNLPYNFLNMSQHKYLNIHKNMLGHNFLGNHLYIPNHNHSLLRSHVLQLLQ